MSLHHEAGATCTLCASKLLTAHPYLRDWFESVKIRYPNVHISWAFRGEEDQNRMKADGKSNASFGSSPHNHMENGKPCSLALDLFLLDEDGVARFPPLFYAKLYSDCKRDMDRIRWGGTFKKLLDQNHFEMA